MKMRKKKRFNYLHLTCFIFVVLLVISILMNIFMSENVNKKQVHNKDAWRVTTECKNSSYDWLWYVDGKLVANYSNKPRVVCDISRVCWKLNNGIYCANVTRIDEVDYSETRKDYI